ncbi:hypothetical protein [Acrocarpospora macrocephala]|nr:hypothetical protein [Acrocarpospora macrocephala]
MNPPVIIRYRCCTCGGTGLINDDQGDAVTCPDCDGTGHTF